MWVWFTVPQNNYNSIIKGYNRNEKVLNFVRTIKMWHRDEVSKSCWKNGASRLAWHRVAADPQFVKKATSAKYSKVEWSAVKWGMLVSVKKPQRGTGHFCSSLPAPPRMPLFFTCSRSLLFPPFWCDPLSLLQPLGLPFFPSIPHFAPVGDGWWKWWSHHLFAFWVVGLGVELSVLKVRCSFHST